MAALSAGGIKEGIEKETEEQQKLTSWSWRPAVPCQRPLPAFHFPVSPGPLALGSLGRTAESRAVDWLDLAENYRIKESQWLPDWPKSVIPPTHTAIPPFFSLKLLFFRLFSFIFSFINTQVCMHVPFISPVPLNLLSWFKVWIPKREKEEEKETLSFETAPILPYHPLKISFYILFFSCQTYANHLFSSTYLSLLNQDFLNCVLCFPKESTDRIWRFWDVGWRKKLHLYHSH